MFYMIIGIALAGLGLVGAAFTSRDRKVRIAAACVGALGVLLLLLSWAAKTPPTKQEEVVRSGCRSAAMRLETFESRRLASLQSWTIDERSRFWDRMDSLLHPIVSICVEDPSSCDRPMSSLRFRATFSPELVELIDAIRSGKSCGP